MALRNYRIAHAVPGRVRFKLLDLNNKTVNAPVLEAWMEGMAGVRQVRVNRSALSLIVEYEPEQVERQALVERLQGFSPQTLPAGSAGDEPEIGMSALATSAITLVALPFLRPPLRRLLTLIAVAPTLAKGINTLLRRGIKVDVLDALAVGLAAARGEYITALITNLLLALGALLERTTERQSNRLLRRLLQPDPAPAWVERDDELIQIPADGVAVNEIVVVGVGERVPVDGRVVTGMALVNQAAITGEDVPVRKEAPKRVVSGSVLVEGRLRIQATQVGGQTTTALVARFIQDALDKRSSTQRLADELADKRVYLTLITGGLVYATTRNLTRLESVFLVDYSCALKLGTPMAFKSGMYRAATEGILMKGGDAIERLAEIDTIIFDKTGTLTHSELLVTDVRVLEPGYCAEEALLAVVASVEEHASHPIAQAVVDAARERELQHISHGEVDYLVAHGMAAAVNGQRIVIGSRHYLEAHEAIDCAAHGAEIERLQDEGKTLLYVGSEGRLIGLLALRDTLRREAFATLASLRAQGIKQLIMITGDRRQKAAALGRELGLDAVYAETEPEEKAAIIQALQQRGHKVAFVGDGVNDGPALASADVGIAMPRGAEIARATADIVLLDDRLVNVAAAHALAQGTMKLIQTNFNLAVGINTGVLAGAIMGWLSPVASAILHNGTTIGILLKALAGVKVAPHRGQGITLVHADAKTAQPRQSITYLPKPADSIEGGGEKYLH